MKRKRPAGEVAVPLPRLARGLTREQWLAAMRSEWADRHVPGSDLWCKAQVALDTIDAFGFDAEEATRWIRWARL